MITECMNDYRLIWTTPSENSAQSMPLGGHDLGCNVWVEQNELLMYFQQSGGFDENSSMLKQGRIRLAFERNPFQHAFSQELVLKDGFIRVRGASGDQSIQIDLWVDVFKPVIHLDLQSSAPIHFTVTYEAWRLEDQLVDSFSDVMFQCKEVWMYPGQVTFHHDEFRVNDQSIIFYHRNQSDDLSFDKEMDAQGLQALKHQLYHPQRHLTTGGMIKTNGLQYTGESMGQYQDTPFKAWHFKTTQPVPCHTLAIVLKTGQAELLDRWLEELETAAAKAGLDLDTARSATIQWWHDFWQKSHVYLNPEIDNKHDLYWRIGRNYQYYRYLQGCNYFSFWPAKFNGGNFTYDPSLVIPDFKFSPDYRRWGGGTFTTQNQRLLFWPMLKNGDFAMMPQLFGFFNRLLATEKVRTSELIKAKGAVYPEQINYYGLCCTVDHGWSNTSGLPVEQIKYLFSNQLEIALLIMEYERYSGSDISDYIDFMAACIEFYDSFYPENDLDGKMFMYPGNALESYHPVENPADGIAALVCVINRLLQLPAKYASDERKQGWQQILDRVPPLPVTQVNGHKVLAYAKTQSEIHNCEMPQLYAVFPYGLYGIGKPDLETAVSTAKYTVETEQQLSHISWQNMGIQYARLQMHAEAHEFLMRKMADSGRRFPAFWGPGHDWTPDLNWGGSGAIQLQEMLLQTDGRAIYILPCWDKSIDVEFKLHAPFATTVEVSLKGGRIEKCEITPPERMADIIYC
jgi:hypothetical protein